MKDITITFDDGETMQFPAVDGESVLASAEKAGNALAHNCRSGTCRTCVAKSDGEEVLLCITPAQPGFHARVPYLRSEVVVPTLRRAKINRFERISPSVWEIRYRLQFPLSFLPGQYVEVLFNGMVSGRYFSMANAPSNKEQILLIRDLPGGAVSEYLTKRAKPEDTFSVRGPFGVFYLRSTLRPKLFVAGGTGLAPVLSMLRTIKTTGARTPLALIVGSASSEDACAIDELCDLAKSLPLEFIATAVTASDGWNGYTGNPVEALSHIKTLPFDSESEAYLCGPPGMVDAAHQRLLALGFDTIRVFSEEFVHSGR